MYAYWLILLIQIFPYVKWPLVLGHRAKKFDETPA